MFRYWLARLQLHQDAGVGLPPIKIVHFDFGFSPISTRRRIASGARIPAAAGEPSEAARAVNQGAGPSVIPGGPSFCTNNRQSGKSSFKYFPETLMTSADPVRRSAMTQLQTHRAKLPTRAAAVRRGRISTAALVASMALIAQILSACSNSPQSFSAAAVAAQYPDLNEPPPMAEVTADQVAHIKAELIQARDEQERGAAQQQALH